MCEKQLFEKLHTSKDGISIVEVDEIISICSYIEIDGKAVKLTENLKSRHIVYMKKIIMMD